MAKRGEGRGDRLRRRAEHAGVPKLPGDAVPHGTPLPSRVELEQVHWRGHPDPVFLEEHRDAPQNCRLCRGGPGQVQRFPLSRADAALRQRW